MCFVAAVLCAASLRTSERTEHSVYILPSPSDASQALQALFFSNRDEQAKHLYSPVCVFVNISTVVYTNVVLETWNGHYFNDFIEYL